MIPFHHDRVQLFIKYHLFFKLNHPHKFVQVLFRDRQAYVSLRKNSVQNESTTIADTKINGFQDVLETLKLLFHIVANRE